MTGWKQLLLAPLIPDHPIPVWYCGAADGRSAAIGAVTDEP